MGFLGVIWGIAGVLWLLGYAILKLLPPSLAAFNEPLLWYHWGLLLANTTFVLYGKAYRGFQRGLSPRIAARASYLGRHPTLLRVVLAPLFVMGYFDIVRRKQIATWAMTVGMVGLILLVRLLPQPWRGIVDASIVLGLGWGMVTILFFSWQTFRQGATLDDMALVADA